MKAFIMEAFRMFVVFTVIICFVAGCGPGEPFEIEEHYISQSQTQNQVALVR